MPLCVLPPCVRARGEGKKKRLARRHRRTRLEKERMERAAVRAGAHTAALSSLTAGHSTKRPSEV